MSDADIIELLGKFSRVIVRERGTPGPRGPVGPTGVGGESATFLMVTRKAGEPIVRGQPLKAISNTHVSLAFANGNLSDATVFGFALSDAGFGEDVNVLIIGVLDDPQFSIFTINSPLFLDEGGITDEKRTTGFHVVVAKSLGGNQIFVNIRDPIVLS